MIGTNREAIHEAVIIEGDTYAWPIAPGVSGHVPLEDLPAETRLLFDYNPELARQMLADAGYPDGFDIEMTIELEPTMMGISEMVAGMWLEDMGIKVDIKAYEVVAVEEIRAERRFLHSFVGDGHPLLGIGAIDMLFSTGGVRNFSNYSNEYFDEQIEKAFATLDEADREVILEELFVMTLDAVPTISFSLSQHAVHWWPWVKNYYGEISAGGFNPPTDLLWIDQDLKAEMGY